MNPNNIAKKQIESVINSTGMYTQTKTWIENQKTVFCVETHCSYCNETYKSHGNAFKKHLSSQKHKDNYEDHQKYYDEQFDDEQKKEHDFERSKRSSSNLFGRINVRLNNLYGQIN
jgi:hypothetical protein